MKILSLLCLLICFNTFAQDNNGETQRQKRPSWSQGLPERKTALKPSASMGVENTSKPKSVALNVSPEMEKPVVPTLEVELVTEPMVLPDPVIEMNVETVQPSSKSRKEAFDQYYGKQNQQNISDETNALLADYKWNVLRTTPIQIPSQFNENDSLRLNIQINPQGRVTRVSLAEGNVPAAVLESAEKSILNWRFQPPGDLGITENISKIFTIDIKTEA